MFKVSKITVDTHLPTLKINITCGNQFRLSLINLQYIVLSWKFQCKWFTHLFWKSSVRLHV